MTKTKVDKNNKNQVKTSNKKKMNTNKVKGWKTMVIVMKRNREKAINQKLNHEKENNLFPQNTII